MEPKTITATSPDVKHIKKHLEDYLSSGYSIKDYCFVNDDIDEASLTTWLEQHNAGHFDEVEDDGFMTVNIIEEPKKRGRPKQQLPAQSLFARIGDIELYQQVSAAYLKSLKA